MGSGPAGALAGLLDRPCRRGLGPRLDVRARSHRDGVDGTAAPDELTLGTLVALVPLAALAVLGALAAVGGVLGHVVAPALHGMGIL